MIYWIFVLGSGLFFRLYHLTLESFWLDEGYAVEMAQRTVAETFRLLSQDLHPPVYTLSLHGWIQMFGHSEFAFRFFSVLFGMLLIPLVYRLARHLFDVSTARYAALLTSFSIFHVYYSQEARPYTLLIFITVLSFYFFVRLLESDKKRYQAGYVLFTIAMLYTHSFGVFTLAAQNAIFLYRLVRGRARSGALLSWVVLQLSLLVLWSPWILITVKFGSSMKDNWISKPTFRELLETLRQYAGGMKLLIVFAALSFWGVWDSFRKEQNASAESLIFWGVIVFLTPFLVSLVWVPIFYPRYMIASTIPFLILTGRGIAALPSARLRTVLIAALLLFCLNGLYQNDRRIDKDQWRQAVGVMNEKTQTGDLVIINSRGEAVYNYYLNRKDLEMRTFPIMKDRFARVYSWDSIYVTPKNIGELAEMTQGHPRVWLIQSHNYDVSGLTDKTMAELYGSPVYHEKFQGIILSLYEKGSAGAA